MFGNINSTSLVPTLQNPQCNGSCLLLLLCRSRPQINASQDFKMNTVEAIAACLYIAGFKEDARMILAPFSFGMEFLKLNQEALEAYSACGSAEEVSALHEMYLNDAKDRQMRKELEKQQREEDRINNGSNYNGYLDESDLPPLEDDDLYEESEEGVDKPQE